MEIFPTSFGASEDDYNADGSNETLLSDTAFYGDFGSGSGRLTIPSPSPAASTRSVSRASYDVPDIDPISGFDMPQDDFGYDDSLLRNARRMQFEDDTAAAVSGYNSASEQVRQYLYDEPDTPLNLTGGAAMGAYAGSLDRLDEIRNDVVSGLGNDDQIAIFDNNWQHRISGIENTIARHEALQRNVVRDENRQALIDAAISDVTANVVDPGTLDLAQRQLHAAVMANADGKSADVVQQEMVDAQGALQTARIRKLADVDPHQAESLLDVHQNLLREEDRDELSKSIAGKILSHEVEFETNRLTSTFDKVGDARQHADKIKDAKVREKVLARVDYDYAEKDRQKKATEASLRDDAWTLAAKGDTSGLSRAQRKVISKSDYTKLTKYAAAKRKGTPIKTSPEDYRKLSDMAAKDPDGFADTELAPWRASLSEADWARLSARQKTFRDDPAARHRVASRHKQIVRAFAGSDLSNTEIGEQLRAVDQTLAATEKRTGKPATAKEFTDIVEINKHRWQLAQDDAVDGGDGPEDTAPFNAESRRAWYKRQKKDALDDQTIARDGMRKARTKNASDIEERHLKTDQHTWRPDSRVDPARQAELNDEYARRQALHLGNIQDTADQSHGDRTERLKKSFDFYQDMSHTSIDLDRKVEAFEEQFSLPEQVWHEAKRTYLDFKKSDALWKSSGAAKRLASFAALDNGATPGELLKKRFDHGRDQFEMDIASKYAHGSEDTRSRLKASAVADAYQNYQKYLDRKSDQSAIPENPAIRAAREAEGLKEFIDAMGADTFAVLGSLALREGAISLRTMVTGLAAMPQKAWIESFVGVPAEFRTEFLLKLPDAMEQRNIDSNDVSAAIDLLSDPEVRLEMLEEVQKESVESSIIGGGMNSIVKTLLE